MDVLVGHVLHACSGSSCWLVGPMVWSVTLPCVSLKPHDHRLYVAKDVPQGLSRGELPWSNIVAVRSNLVNSCPGYTTAAIDTTMELCPHSSSMYVVTAARQDMCKSCSWAASLDCAVLALHFFPHFGLKQMKIGLYQ